MTMTWYRRKGLATRNRHVEYESSITYFSKVISNVKVFSRQTNRLTDRQDRQKDGQELYLPDISMQGNKKL